MKEQILRAAIVCFSQYGVKGVSMDDIAGTIRISKKTIYEYFKDKDTLFRESMVYELERIRGKVAEIQVSAPTLLEGMIRVSMYMFKQSFSFCPAFFKDLQRYPDVYEKLKEHMQFMQQGSLDVFTQAVQEGFFNPGLDYEILSNVFRNQIESIVRDATMTRTQKEEMYTYSLLTFLNGLSTEKGRRVLEAFTPQKLYVMKY